MDKTPENIELKIIELYNNGFGTRVIMYMAAKWIVTVKNAGMQTCIGTLFRRSLCAIRV